MSHGYLKLNKDEAMFQLVEQKSVGQPLFVLFILINTYIFLTVSVQ